MSRVHDALRKSGQESNSSFEVPEGSPVVTRKGEAISHPLRQIGQLKLRSPSSSGDSVPKRPDVQFESGPAGQPSAELAREEQVVRRGATHRKHGRLDSNEIAEQEIVNLVQRLFVFPNSRAPRLVVFSDVERTAGAAEICIRTARALANHVSGSVCLIDANLAAPSFQRLLGVDGAPGFTDAMVNHGPISEFAIQVTGTNLWFVPSGSPEIQRSALFASDRLSSRMSELREEFDYVLVNAPPIISHGDAVLLGQLADGVVLVVEANSTHRETARAAKERLQGANVRVIGAILNNHTFPIPEALYRKL